MTASSIDFSLGAAAAALPESAGGGAFEGRLIAEAQTGSHEAFGKLVQRHQETVYRFCRRWAHCPEDARDICQDTFLRAWDALPRYRPEARFSTWLYRIALNLCRDRSRSRAARQGSLTDRLCSHVWPCPRPQPDEVVSKNEDLEKLARGLAVLPRRLREALILSAVEGLGHRECAEILGCTVRAVESRVFRARRDLIEWWDQAG